MLGGRSSGSASVLATAGFSDVNPSVRVPLGANFLGQHPTAGLRQGNGFTVERGDPFEDPLARLGDRQ